MPISQNSRHFEAQHGAAFTAGRASPLIEIILVATPLVAIIFQLVIGSLTPILVILTGAAFAFLRWERLYPTIVTCWPLLLLPGLALTSALWSDSVPTTLRYGTLYLATVLVAVFIGAGIEGKNILKGLFLAFAIYMVFSLLFGRYAYWSGEGGLAFVGLLGSKNASGDVGALTVLISTTMLIWAASLRRYKWAIGALLVLAMGLFTLWQSKATGALIATIVALPCLLLWIASRRLDERIRASIFIVAVTSVLLLIATFEYWLVPLFDLIVENSGKDKGLTGRDVIWAKADELIAERPWLGQGYRSFWIHHNLDAEYIWRYMGISNRTGYNFHHTPREILVALGYVGLVTFATVSLFAILKLLLRTSKTPTYAGILCCTLIVFQSPRIFFEVLGFSDTHFSTIMIFMVFAFGLRPEVFPRFQNESLNRERPA